MPVPSDLQPLPPLAWLRAFETAARLESFTSAAQELGLSQATVSQQIRKLESRLGTELFHRLARGVELTADGAAYLPHVHAAFSALARSTRDLFGTDRRRTITLASPASFVALWLAPRLPGLEAAAPRLSLSIAAIHRPADYELENADIEIRYGDGDWPGADKAPLLAEVLSPVCAPALLKKEADWTRLPAIAIAGARVGWSEWCAFAGVPPPGPPALRFDSFISALEASKAGAGVLLASLPLADGSLREGSLKRLSSVELRTSAGHWLVRDSGRLGPGDADLVWRWLIDQPRTG
ncbi:LysR family transcriptional regulator [Ferruginivarius sediminum]|uniref:LysR family transcriptional regulator n=1 Tax=Ferruginivarius sediminum TaxID=2661937 RepID=A0A369T6J7_9PROT|nr:LysR family transcriptional regulator [Ferruginivarius sediminum]RDD60953.1 LysR family transcriptional regulator [Ferruginivarius sediminum]